MPRVVDSRQQPLPFRLPDVFTYLRILGSPVLVVLSAQRLLVPSLLWAGGLLFTEWFDGFLARRLRLASAGGARLDSIADSVFYGSLLMAIAAWRPLIVWQEAAWVLAALTSYLISQACSWHKFACFSSYHTWSAKFAWCVVVPGIAWLVMGDQPWLFRLAMLWVLCANIEAMMITRLLPQAAVDVPSLWHAGREVSSSAVGASGCDAARQAEREGRQSYD